MQRNEPDDGPTKHSKRRSKSCKRCLRRKQRCHGFPICSNCEEAGHPCEQSEFARQLHRHDGNYAAFKRIQNLEARLNDTLTELSRVRQDRDTLAQLTVTEESALVGDPSNSTSNQRQPREYDVADGNPTDNTIGHQPAPLNRPEHIRESLSPSPDEIPVDPPLPTQQIDHGYTVDQTAQGQSPESDLEQIVQATVWTKALPPSDIERLYTSNNHADPQNRIVELPGDEIGHRILQTYFDKIHPRYPFLDRTEVYRLHARRYQIDLSSHADRFGVFKLNMVYAIGVTLLQLTASYSKTSPESHFMAALQHVSAARQSHTLRNIEAMTLLVIYKLRSPFNSGIWYMIGLAMRTCIDMGLHREASYKIGDPFQNEMKRRLFWSVYLLERVIALSLRRPFSIAESDIDTQAPSDTIDVLNQNTTEVMVPNHTSTESSNPSPSSKLAMWSRFIQIKRFESRVHSEVYCLNQSPQSLFSRVGPLLASLDTWGQSLPVLTEAENSYMQLQWNKAVVLLLRPFLSLMQHDDPLIARCLKSCGQVCEIFKRMHQRDSYGHSFISAHSTFIAGITLW
jgi:hypothetical protein